MTSVYRQIGIGCEKLFRTVLRDSLGLSDQDVHWFYEAVLPTGKTRRLYLDARVPVSQIADERTRERFREWMRSCAKAVGIDPIVCSTLKGAVFEVRQGYQSKYSKRQVADIVNAATAYTQAYLPCLAILSTQIDTDILYRYKREKWVVITGVVGSNNPLTSTYDFMKDIVGYDLAGFFERNAHILRKEIEFVLNSLLSRDDQ